MTPIIEAALERLEGVCSVTILIPGTFENALEEPLAALIRKAAEPRPTWLECHFCGNYSCDGHAPDCALIQLCEAIAPGVKP